MLVDGFSYFFIDSSQYDGSHSGTLGKDRGNKGRKKWGGILGGKHKHASRHYEDNVDGMRGLHDTLPKHPLPTTISKEAMVCNIIAPEIFLFVDFLMIIYIFSSVSYSNVNWKIVS